MTDFLLSPSWWPDYCYDDSSVKANFTSTNVAAVKAKITTALLNVRQAMRNAGYADSAWTMVVQDYPSPIPSGAGFRYSQSGYTRQNTGGCGFWNKDADWANATALPTINNTVKGAVTASGIAGVKILELQSAFNGRRLCENTVGLLEEKGLASWTSAGAVDKTEWVDQIRTVSTATSNYYIQESLHPNYWGELAERGGIDTGAAGLEEAAEFLAFTFAAHHRPVLPFVASSHARRVRQLAKSSRAWLGSTQKRFNHPRRCARG